MFGSEVTETHFPAGSFVQVSEGPTGQQNFLRCNKQKTLHRDASLLARRTGRAIYCYWCVMSRMRVRDIGRTGVTCA
jgi:hypothetical protein